MEIAKTRSKDIRLPRLNLVTVPVGLASLPVGHTLDALVKARRARSYTGSSSATPCRSWGRWFGLIAGASGETPSNCSGRPAIAGVSGLNP